MPPVFIERLSHIMGEPKTGIYPGKRIVIVGKGKGQSKALVKYSPSARHVSKSTPYPDITEAVADTIDDLLGWNLVPPTIARVPEPALSKRLRLTEGDAVTFQEWIPGATPLGAMNLKRKRTVLAKNADRLVKMMVFDYLIGNTDRHENNILVDRRGLVWAIDHDPDYSFRTKDYLNRPGPRRLPEHILHDLQNLTEEDLRAALAPLGAVRTRAVIHRWKLLKRSRRLPEGLYTASDFVD